MMEEKIKAIILQCSEKIKEYQNDKRFGLTWYDELIEENKIIMAGLALLLKELKVKPINEVK